MKKKIMALVLASSMLLSVACSDKSSSKKNKNDKDDEEIEEVDEVEETKASEETKETEATVVETTVEEPEVEETEVVTEDNTPLGRFLSLIADTQADYDEFEDYYVVYDSEVNGSFRFYQEDKTIYLKYASNTQDEFTVLFNTENMNARATVSLGYEGNYTSYYNSVGLMGLSDMKDYIDAGDAEEKCFVLDEGMGHGDKIEGIDERAGIARLYSRWFKLFDELLTEYGYSYEELGLEKDRMVTDVSYQEKLDCEPVMVVTEHVFENGVCTECSKNWNECLTETIVASYPDRTDSMINAMEYYLPSFVHNFDTVNVICEPAYNNITLVYNSNNYTDGDFSVYIYRVNPTDNITFLFSYEDESLKFDCLPGELDAIIADPTYASLPSYTNMNKKSFEMTPEFWEKVQTIYPEVVVAWNDSLARYGMSLTDIGI